MPFVVIESKMFLHGLCNEQIRKLKHVRRSYDKLHTKVFANTIFDRSDTTYNWHQRNTFNVST